MVKKFTIPFASQGDANDIPDALQVDGKVSFTQGFGYDYERPYDDPQAKDIAREDMNGLFKAITSAVGELQTLGASEWSNAITYPKGAIVYFEKDLYISQVDDNQNKPPQSWTSIKNIADDSLKKAMNLADLTDKNSARNNLGLGNSATLNKTDILGASSDLVATQKLVNDTKINLDNSVRAVDTKADKAQSSANSAQSTANTAVTKADNAQSRADSAYNLANSKQDKLTFVGDGPEVMKTGAFGVGSKVGFPSETTSLKTNLPTGFYAGNEIPIPGAYRWGSVIAATRIERTKFIYLPLEGNNPVFVGDVVNGFSKLYGDTNTTSDKSGFLRVKGSSNAITEDDVTQDFGDSEVLVASQSLVTALNSKVSNHGLGYSQKWVDVKGSRSSEVVYTNNTTKPICVNISITFVSNGRIELFVSGIKIAVSDTSSSSAVQFVSAIVQPGESYYAKYNKPVNIWVELR